MEWLRRNDPVLDKHLRTYLFTEGSIRDIEADARGDDPTDTTRRSEQPDAAPAWRPYDRAEPRPHGPGGRSSTAPGASS